MGWEQNAIEKSHLMTNERHDKGAEDHLLSRMVNIGSFITINTKIYCDINKNTQEYTKIYQKIHVK